MMDFSDFEALFDSDEFRSAMKAAAGQAVADMDYSKADLNTRLAMLQEAVICEMRFALRAYHEWLQG